MMDKHNQHVVCVATAILAAWGESAEKCSPAQAALAVERAMFAIQCARDVPREREALAALLTQKVSK